MLRDCGLDPTQPQESLFNSIIAEETSGNSTHEPIPIGFASYFYAYSTWEGRSLYLMSLFVKDTHRKNGVGELLIKELARHAKELGCKCINFHVNNRSPAPKFYQKLGAVDITKTESWNLYQFD